MTCDVGKSLAYARKWAFGRNPDFFNFDKLGGDCTNFASQCLYAGCGVMNYTPDLGWFYNSISDRAAAWTGVQYLYNFLTTNKGPGPFGHEAPISETRPGDIIQLSFDGIRFAHTPFVVRTGRRPNPRNILIAAHSEDAYNRPLSTYRYKAARLIKIDGVRPN